MNTFTDTALQAAAIVVGGLGPIALGFLVVRFLLALIYVWEEAAEYARLVAEEAAKANPRVVGITRCPNPRYMSIQLRSSKGIETTLPAELPSDMHWERK